MMVAIFFFNDEELLWKRLLAAEIQHVRWWADANPSRERQRRLPAR